MAQQASSRSTKGGLKLRRCGKKSGYYAQQYNRTASNKARRARKRAHWKAYWASPAGKRRKAGWPQNPFSTQDVAA